MATVVTTMKSFCAKMFISGARSSFGATRACSNVIQRPLAVRRFQYTRAQAMNQRDVFTIAKKSTSDDNALIVTDSLNTPPQRNEYARVPTLGMLPFVGAASAANEPVLGETAVWLLSSCVGIGSIKLGLPGVAAQTVFFAPLGAMKEISKEGTTGQLPLLPYSAMAASGYLWMVYGFLNDNAAIWVPNVPALAMGLFYTGMFCKYAPAGANWLPGTKGMHVAGIVASCAGVTGVAYALPIENAIFALGSYGTAVVIVMFAGPLSAMKTVIQDKSTQSLPFAMTVATFVNCSLWTVYGTMVISDFFIWFPNAMGLASSIVQLGLFAKFGFHKSDK